MHTHTPTHTHLQTQSEAQLCWGVFVVVNSLLGEHILLIISH